MIVIIKEWILKVKMILISKKFLLGRKINSKKNKRKKAFNNNNKKKTTKI